MSSSFSSFLSPPPPPGTNWIAVIQPSLTLTMIGTVFSAIMVPILIALFFFSTSHTRRQPIFVLNVFALLLGIAEGFCNGYVEIRGILSPSNPASTSAFYANAFLMVLTPWLVECILILRLVVVFPAKTTSRRTLVAIYTFPALVKTARIINLCLFFQKYVTLARILKSPLPATQVMWNTQPYTKIDWILQVFDNAYASTLFIYRLRRGPKTSEGVIRGGRLGARLRGLFLIALSNFVIPSALSLVQLIFLFRNPSDLSTVYVNVANDYITIIGVVFATVWSTSSRWATAQGLTSEDVLSAPSVAGNNMHPVADSTPKQSRNIDTYISTAPRFTTIPNLQLNVGEEPAVTVGEKPAGVRALFGSDRHQQSDDSLFPARGQVPNQAV